LLRIGGKHVGQCFGLLKDKSEFRVMEKNLSLQNVINAVREFHDAFKIPNSERPNASLSEDEIMLRYRLMAEENDEYLEAAKNSDMVEIADALGDQLYILCGTILRHGMQDVIEDVFKEIQASNMSKLGEDGTPIYREDGKVMKGPNYFKPDIKGAMENAIMELEP
tara:strand:+ start:1481 stop:1978 length:498 start_codon:yes stop_codon:yes gene_type:complete